MSMYDNQNPFSDFDFQLDDFVVSRLIDLDVFRRLTGEQYAIIRATVRSELLYSDEIAAVIRPSVGKFAESVRGITLRFRIPGGLGDFSLYKSGSTEGTDVVRTTAPGGRDLSGGVERTIYGGGGFVGFDDILLERWLPAQQFASMEPAELATFAALLKGELLFSERVHDHLRNKVAETVKEFSKG